MDLQRLRTCYRYVAVEYTASPWGHENPTRCHALRFALVSLAQEYVPEDKLVHAKRVIYGLNQGKPVGTLDLDEACLTRAKQDDFDLRTASFRAAPEQFRPPRVVRIGLIQNKIVLPTDAPYAQQAKVGTRGLAHHTHAQKLS